MKNKTRKIKFRVWDKYNKEMLGVENLDFEYGEMSIRTDMYNDYYSPKDMILMQYTGLKDENDTKIYEGDILTDGTDFAIVEWSEDRASFILKPIGEYYFDTDILGEALDDYDESFAVVGNIYENKKLLEVK